MLPVKTDISNVETSLLHSAILRDAGNAIIATDSNGIITLFNQTAEKMLGYSASEVVGISTPALFHDPEEIGQRAIEVSRELGEWITMGFEVFVAKASRGLSLRYT